MGSNMTACLIFKALAAAGWKTLDPSLGPLPPSCAPSRSSWPGQQPTPVGKRSLLGIQTRCKLSQIDGGSLLLGVRDARCLPMVIALLVKAKSPFHPIHQHAGCRLRAVDKGIFGLAKHAGQLGLGTWRGIVGKAIPSAHPPSPCPCQRSQSHAWSCSCCRAA